MTRVSVIVMPKAEILDPQGKTVLKALHALGFAEVLDCRIGKVIRLKVETPSGPDAVRIMAEEMAKALLANPVTEEYEVDIEEG